MSTVYVKILLLFCCFLNFSALAQNPQQYLKFANEAYEEKDFYGASVYYRKVLDADSSDIKILYLLAESLRQSADYKKAALQYELVLQKDVENQFPEALFWLAMMQKNSAEYSSARENFLKYTAKSKNKNTWFYKKAVHEAEACLFAQELMNDTLLHTVVNAGEEINTNYSEIGLNVVNDSLIYFSGLIENTLPQNHKSSKKGFHLKLYEATLKNGKWKSVNELSEDVNLKGLHTVNAANGHYQNRLYFTTCDNRYTCNIYYISEKGENSSAHFLKSINAEGYTTTNPSIALIDGTEVLFFTSDRPGGEGGMDIWFSILKNGEFSKPRNLGSVVNTIDDEVAPYYDSDDKVLYFSSSWHKGLGGYDIFRSKGSIRNPGTPENLGFPINSSANDLHYRPVKNGALLISNRKGSLTTKSETCCNDIWIVSEDNRNTYTADTKNKESDKAFTSTALDSLKNISGITVYFHNDEPEPKTLKQETTLSYSESYSSYINLEQIYLQEYSRAATEDSFTTSHQLQIQKLFSENIRNGMQNLEELAEVLLEALKEKYIIHIDIVGHASPLAATAYNTNLSLRRISSIKNYIQSYNNEALKKYLENSISTGSLFFSEFPMGEYQTNIKVSDEYDDIKNSVYNPEAALERRTEIKNIFWTHPDSSYALLMAEKHYQIIKPHSQASLVKFLIHNKGNSLLKIEEIKIPENLQLIESSAELLPNQQTALVLKYHKPKNNTPVSVVEIISNSFSGNKKLFIVSEH